MSKFNYKLFCFLGKMVKIGHLSAKNGFNYEKYDVFNKFFEFYSRITYIVRVFSTGKYSFFGDRK